MTLHETLRLNLGNGRISECRVVKTAHGKLYALPLRDVGASKVDLPRPPQRKWVSFNGKLWVEVNETALTRRGGTNAATVLG